MPFPKSNRTLHMHFAVINRGNCSDTEVRKAGCFSLGSPTRPHDEKNKLRQLPASAANDLVVWGNTTKWLCLQKGPLIKYTVSAPKELWGAADRCGKEIAQAVSNDLSPFVGQGGWFQYAHVQILPCELQEGGVADAA